MDKPKNVTVSETQFIALKQIVEGECQDFAAAARDLDLGQAELSRRVVRLAIDGHRDRDAIRAVGNSLGLTDIQLLQSASEIGWWAKQRLRFLLTPWTCILRWMLSALLLLAFAAILCAWLTISSPTHELVVELLEARTWIAYNPTTFRPLTNESPTVEDMKSDLEVLHGKTRIRGLVTFGSDRSLHQIPSIAKQAGFEEVLMGVYLPLADPANVRIQIDNAIAQHDADGYLIFVAGDDPSLGELAKYVDELKVTRKPVGIRFDANDYFGPRGNQILELGDFLAPDVPVLWWREGADPGKLIQELQARIDRLTSVAPEDKAVLVGMVSFPSGGKPGLTEDNQEKFYEMIFRGDVRLPRHTYIYFYDAFDPPDAPGLQSRAEAHRGIFNNDRSPKPAVQIFGDRIP